VYFSPKKRILDDLGGKNVTKTPSFFIFEKKCKGDKNCLKKYTPGSL